METGNTNTIKQDNNSHINNPYPGLRPFLPEDHHLFFGRDNQVSEVLEKLTENKFIAIIGNSGIGKSSFINCGILPKLKNSFSDENNTWETITFRPSNAPLDELTKAFSKYFKGQNTEKDFNENAVLDYLGDNYLADRIIDHAKEKKVKFLLYVDQFEETFRYQDSDKDAADKSSKFIDLLIKMANQDDIPVYVTITMRSDYIGECSKHPKLTSLINNSQFLIPQMTREEKRQAIEMPCQTVGCKISSTLVDEILDNIGDATDRLPVMQHALMRTWDYWQIHKIGNEEISISHYNSIGGMESALSVHANEIFNGLKPELKPICEKAFKSLTEKGEEGRSYRKPAKIHELAEISQASPSEVIEIVEAFRKPGNTLLTPSIKTDLSESTIIDISHESIMRIWTTLDTWMEEEYESVKQYLRIAEAAEMQQSGKGTLLIPPELQMATNWYENTVPTKAWGIRHNIAYDRTIEYLKVSEKQFERKQRLKAKAQKRRLRLSQIIAGILGTLVLAAIFFMIYAIRQKNEANEQKKVATEQAERAEKQSKIALEKEQEALEQKKYAQKEAQRAQLKEREANISRKRAEEERLNALNQRKKAEVAGEKAMREEKKASKLRMFSIARSMSIKSLLESDAITRALVARQAYNFYFDNEGTGTDPDIYNALYYALKMLDGEEFSSLKGHNDNVRSIVTNKNHNHFYSASSDGKILKWHTNDKYKITKANVWGNERLVHITSSMSNDGKWLITGGSYPYLLLFNMKSGSMEPQKVKLKTSQTIYSKFTPKNDIVFISSTNKILFYNFNTISEIASLDSKVNAMDVDVNGKYVVVGLENGTISAYNLYNNTSTPTVIYRESSGKAITSLRFSDDGKKLAVGTIKGGVEIIDVKNKRVIASLKGHTARVNQVCFNHSGTKVASASFDHTVRIWDTQNLYNQPVILSDHKDWVWSIAFSANDKYLIAGCRDNLVRSWIMDIHYLASSICKHKKVNRQLTQEEWDIYVGEDMERECTCIGKCD